MKHFFLTSLFIFPITASQSQTTTPGYYINLLGDTLTTQIKFRKSAFGQSIEHYTREVDVVDSINGIKKLTPTDIKEFGFAYERHKYVFISKPVKDGTYKFLVPIFRGSRASLYQYGFYTSGGGYASASQQTFYTFEKPDHEYLFLKNILNKKFKNELKDFFKDDTDLLQLIDQKLQYWLDINKDLIEIMKAINKN